MNGRVSVLAVGLLVAGLIFLSAGDTRAGSGPASFASCFQTPGTSMCQGNFVGFLQDSDPDSYAGFETSDGNNYFSAHLAGQDYSCTVSATLYPQVAAYWPQTTSFKGLFFINWDAQGFCSALSFWSSSTYQ